MSEPDISRLTEAQRVCLRLVHDQRQAKEIARMIGISEAAVKQRLRSARQALGVDSSIEAARALHRAEGGHAYPRGIYPSGSVAPQSNDDILAAFPGSGAEAGATGEVLTFGDAGEPFRILEIDNGFPLPFATRRRPRNDLTWWQLLLYGFGLATGVAVLVAAGFNLLASIKSVLEAHPPA